MDAQAKQEWDAGALLHETEAWRAMLERCASAFAAVEPGGRIAFVAGEDLATPVSQISGDMMVWTVGGDGTVALSHRPFAFYDDGAPAADLLFRMDAETLAAVQSADTDTLAKRLASRSKRGKMMLYFLIGRDDLEDRGYFQFLEQIGLSFLGPCR